MRFNANSPTVAVAVIGRTEESGGDDKAVGAPLLPIGRGRRKRKNRWPAPLLCFFESQQERGTPSEVRRRCFRRRRTVTPEATIDVVTASPDAAQLPPPLDEKDAREGHCLRRHWSQGLPPLLPFTLAPDFIETEEVVALPSITYASPLRREAATGRRDSHC
nr:hypothetical protein Iba_chr14bCG10770 [Ipomoea batatas]